MSNMEQTIRSFMRQGDNRKCFICGQNGPQYLVMEFGTFVCTFCSGIHRGFGHVVKHATLSTWTKEEVSHALNTGNQKGNQLYLATYNPKKDPRPQAGDASACRSFIQHCFVDKLWIKSKGKHMQSLQHAVSGEKEEFRPIIQPTPHLRKTTREKQHLSRKVNLSPDHHGKTNSRPTNPRRVELDDWSEEELSPKPVSSPHSTTSSPESLDAVLDELFSTSSQPNEIQSECLPVDLLDFAPATASRLDETASQQKRMLCQPSSYQGYPYSYPVPYSYPYTTPYGYGIGMGYGMGAVNATGYYGYPNGQYSQNGQNNQ